MYMLLQVLLREGSLAEGTWRVLALVRSDVRDLQEGLALGTDYCLRYRILLRPKIGSRYACCGFHRLNFYYFLQGLFNKKPLLGCELTPELNAWPPGLFGSKPG